MCDANQHPMNIVSTFIFANTLYIVSGSGVIFKLVCPTPDLNSWHFESIIDLTSYD